MEGQNNFELKWILRYRSPAYHRNHHHRHLVNVLSPGWKIILNIVFVKLGFSQLDDKSTLEGSSWWWRRDRQSSWGRCKGIADPSMSWRIKDFLPEKSLRGSTSWKWIILSYQRKGLIGLIFAKTIFFGGILTQATRAKSLPGTSRIAAIRKLMKRVPVENKISCIRYFVILQEEHCHLWAPVRPCQLRAMP